MDKVFKIVAVLSTKDNMSAGVGLAVSKSTKKLKAMDRIAKSFDDVGKKALVAGGVTTAFFGKTINDAEQSEVAVSRLQQVFTSMGYSQSRAAKSAEDYASKLQTQIGIDDEAIMQVQAKLATFEKVINKTGEVSNAFERATVLAFDMAGTGFGEASANAVQLGKALQDPVKGVNAMARSGITFTATEKQKIKALAESGRLHKAQEIILRAVEKQVSGVAAKTATTSAKTKAAWGEVSEQIGKVLLPEFKNLATRLIVDVIPKVQAFIAKHPQLVRWVAAVGAGLLIFGTIVKVIAFGVSGLSTTFAFLSNVLKITGRVIGVVGRIFLTNPIGLVVTTIALAAFLIIRYWNKIGPFFKNLLRIVGIIFLNGLTALANLFLKYTPAGLIYKHWNKITSFFAGLWHDVKQPFLDALDWILGLGPKMLQAGKNILKNIIDGILSLINKPVELIQKLVGKIRKFLPFSPAKEGPLRDLHRIRLVETIAETIKPAPVVRAMQKVGAAVINSAHNPVNALPVMQGASGGSIVVNFSPTIHSAGNSSSVIAELKKYEKDFLRLLDEGLRKRERLKF